MVVLRQLLPSIFIGGCYALDISNNGHAIINLQAEKHAALQVQQRKQLVFLDVCIETFRSTISDFNAFSVYVFDQNELRYLRLLCVNERITCTQFAYMISMFGNKQHSHNPPSPTHMRKNFTDTQTKTKCRNKTHKHVAAAAS